jgi:hypothetical protein
MACCFPRCLTAQSVADRVRARQRVYPPFTFLTCGETFARLSPSTRRDIAAKINAGRGFEDRHEQLTAAG